MSTATFEINDAGIRVGVDGELRFSSPGVAVLDGERLLIGEEARSNARLLPRWTNNRFWSELGTDKVASATGNIRHNADLAFTHLEHVWETLGSAADGVVFAVPGFYKREQLGLLLGMAKESNVPVVGVTDTALAAVAGKAAHPTVLHLDISLHRILLTILKSDTTLRRVETIVVSETGLFTLWDRWANIIARQFIQTSRYDPMHQAVSEQKLFDALPSWIRGLTGARATPFELDVGSNRHQVVISTEQLLPACSAIYPQIVQQVRRHIPPGERASLFVSDRFGGFPGFVDSLSLITSADISWLGEDSVLIGVADNEKYIASRAGTISHVTSLPVSVARPAQGHVKPLAGRPTHILIGANAFAIGNALRLQDIEGGRPVQGDKPRCTLFPKGAETLVQNHAGDAILLNNAPLATEAVLAPGDVLTISGTSITLISVH